LTTKLPQPHTTSSLNDEQFDEATSSDDDDILNLNLHSLLAVDDDDDDESETKHLSETKVFDGRIQTLQFQTNQPVVRSFKLQIKKSNKDE
jgi:hypothetical protein